MALFKKIWAPISVHEMVVTFLQAECHKFTIERYRRADNVKSRKKDMVLIHDPDLNNAIENHRRWRLLNMIRAKQNNSSYELELRIDFKNSNPNYNYSKCLIDKFPSISNSDNHAKGNWLLSK